jgi:hypothetical protein
MHWIKREQHLAGAVQPQKHSYALFTNRLEMVCRRAYTKYYATWMQYCLAIAHSIRFD